MNLADIASIVLFSIGAAFFAAGTLALARLPDTLTRIHALSKADNPGLAFIVLGALPQAGSLLAGAKMVAIWLLVQLASGAVAQLMAASAQAEGADGADPGAGASPASAGAGASSASMPPGAGTAIGAGSVSAPSAWPFGASAVAGKTADASRGGEGAA